MIKANPCWRYSLPVAGTLVTKKQSVMHQLSIVSYEEVWGIDMSSVGLTKS